MGHSSSYRRLLFVLIGFFMVVSAYPQKAYNEIMADISRAGGIYNMYSFKTPAQTPQPKGYVPFYISHYGRHGARYILRDEQYDSVVAVIQKAFDAKKLTAKGIDCYHRLMSIYPAVKNRAGDLSSKGAWQQHMLAKRMYRQFPEVFQKNSKIEAYASIFPRCIQSMAAFCEGLKEINPSLQIYQETSKADMPYLNPYKEYNSLLTKQDLEWVTPKASWYKDYERFCKKHMDVDAFLPRIFNDTAYVKKVCNPMELEQNLFFIAVSMPCIDFAKSVKRPTETSFYDLFTKDELFNLWQCDNYFYYVQKGPDPRNKGRMPALSSLVLKDIIDCAEQDMEKGFPRVHLRFGHDGVIMALLTYMQIDGWTTAVNDPEEIKDVWQNYRIPMAANVQFIFYKNVNHPKDVLVKVMLNEEEIKLPVKSDKAPYYHWNDVKRFYTSLLDHTKL